MFVGSFVQVRAQIQAQTSSSTLRVDVDALTQPSRRTLFFPNSSTLLTQQGADYDASAPSLQLRIRQRLLGAV